MLPPVTKRCRDISTDRRFRFAFFCDACGVRWESEAYPFSMRDVRRRRAGEEKAKALLWKAEHDAGYERANTEAILHFNRCHGCGRRVCDDCFSELDAICRSCEKQRKEGGHIR